MHDDSSTDGGEPHMHAAYDIHFDDGDVELGIVEGNVRHAASGDGSSGVVDSGAKKKNNIEDADDSDSDTEADDTVAVDAGGDATNQDDDEAATEGGSSTPSSSVVKAGPVMQLRKRGTWFNRKWVWKSVWMEIVVAGSSGGSAKAEDGHGRSRGRLVVYKRQDHCKTHEDISLKSLLVANKYEEGEGAGEGGSTKEMAVAVHVTKNGIEIGEAEKSFKLLATDEKEAREWASAIRKATLECTCA
jgi:hypothetical protein